MPKTIFTVVMCALSICNYTQSLDIPPSLQQKISYISEQIELARSSQYLIFGQNLTELLLTDIAPIHAYILSNAPEFITHFSEFYDELINQLHNNAEQAHSFIQVQENLQHILFCKLDEAMVHWHDPKANLFVQHLSNIATIIRNQRRLQTANSIQSSLSYMYEATSLASEKKLPSTKCRKVLPPLRIQELLDRKKLTVQGLAQKSALHESYIYKLKNNRSSYSQDTLRRLAVGFGVSVQELFANPEQYPGDLASLHLIDSFFIPQARKIINRMVLPTASLRIGELMKKNGWSIKQLSEKSGLCQAVISRIIHNKRDNCAQETLQKLIVAFGVAPEELFISPFDD